MHILLLSPVHNSPGKNERGNDVKGLLTGTAESVEESSVESAGKRSLTVRRQRVGGDALGSWAA